MHQYLGSKVIKKSLKIPKE